jgi:hypothetical protein
MIQLSNSSLALFVECPRCFKNDKSYGIPRPRGIFSSLPNGIDKLLKQSFDSQRGTLPEIICRPELNGYVLFDNDALLKKYRNWKSSPLKYKDASGNVLVGALDDLLYNPSTDTYAMLDFKTRGASPDQEYCEKYYQKQVDTYALLLLSGGFKVADFGVLLYFYPIESENESIKFESKAFLLKPNPMAAQELFSLALACLGSEISPPSSPECQYCSYVAKIEAE